MGGNESTGREHAKMTFAMGWTQRKRQTKEEVDSQVSYATPGKGVQLNKDTEDVVCGWSSGRIWRWAGVKM